jgi:excisionase family DNA binding protein
MLQSQMEVELQESNREENVGEQILVSKRDSAAALGISLRTLDMLIAVRELKSVRVGRRRLIPRHELEKFARHDHVFHKNAPSTKQD